MAQIPIHEKMIQREVAVIAYRMHLSNPELNYNDPELKCGLHYKIQTDEEYIYIQYKDKYIKQNLKTNHASKTGDLYMSLDDFAERILQPIIIILRDGFNTYDDAGQII